MNNVYNVSYVRKKLYAFLVNRHPGIQVRYHRMHDGTSGPMKCVSWLYLFWLNFCYYVLCCRFLDKSPADEAWGEKKLPLDTSESALAMRGHLSVESCVEELMAYDVISFDVFDTLLFRPFSEPSDVFFFIGEKLGILDFKHMRMWAEKKERQHCQTQHGHTEITLEEIWARLEHETGIAAADGIELEKAAEWQFCFANSYMLEVFRQLCQRGKRLIAVSDMYLSADFLLELLKKNGYTGLERLYISSEYRKSKSEGSLFDFVKDELGKNIRIVHVGDNPASDIAMAKRHGIDTFYYQNVNKKSVQYRAYDMSPVIGGAYRGIVNAHLYAGVNAYEMEYEYGFIYGGLFALGYCSFLHEYCKNQGIDQLLFLARDGDILKKVYDRMYPGEGTAYACWSRMAATKLMAKYNRKDYFRRFLFHKADQGRTIRQVLTAMELEFLCDELCDELEDKKELTSQNVTTVQRFLEERWMQVLTTYEPQHKAAKQYYSELLKGCTRACAVDIGWAGSGAMSLAYLVDRDWKLPCRLIGAIAGTNTAHCGEADMSEIQLQSGQLVAYLYASSMNRDLWKKHDPSRDYNVYWELLLSSVEPHFRGFMLDEMGNVQLNYGKKDENQKGIREIQRGILDFVEEYQRHFAGVPYMYRISGRDAYAPMLVAASHKERYLKQIKEKFSLDIGIGD